jgi:predicted nucleic acid binding AN1-type Zn finger protein
MTKMPCQHCKKKCGIPLKCSFCPGEFCVRCRYMEVHKCPGIEEKKKKDLEVLQGRLKYEVQKQSTSFERC